jgi:hypothetical protein
MEKEEQASALGDGPTPQHSIAHVSWGFYEAGPWEREPAAHELDGG